MEAKSAVLTILAIILANYQLAESLQYTADVIDSQLSEINANLVKEEAKIESLAVDLVAFINLTVVNLRTTNKTLTKAQQLQIGNLRVALENLAALLTDLATLDSYWPYVNVKSCADANRKVTEIDFDIRQYYELVGKVSGNVSRLAQQQSWAAYYYSAAFLTLINGYTNGQELQQRTAAILTSANGLVVEFYSYIGQLQLAVFNETVLGTYLNLFKRQYCICATSTSTNAGSNLSTLESNVKAIEQPLVDLQTAVLAVAKDALKKAATAAATLVGSSAPSLSTNVDSTRKFLTYLVTASDYREITFGNVKTCSDLNVRIGLVWFKYYQYQQTLIACNTNATLTRVLMSKLNASVVGVRLNEKQLSATRDLMSAMMKLEPLMRNYSSQLSYSVVKMVRVWVDIKFFGDSFCACSDANKTVSSSTKNMAITSKSSASTTLGMTSSSTSLFVSTTSTTKATTSTSTMAPTTSTSTPTTSTTTTSTLAPTTTPAPTTTTTTTTTTSTTTTTATTTTAVPCANVQFISYNPRLQPTLPRDKNAFSGGTYLDGTVAYVGTANITSCTDQNLMPARISIGTGASFTGAGAYPSCGNVFAQDSASYLLPNSRFKWVLTDDNNALSVPGGMIVRGYKFGYLIGRITLKSSSGVVYQQVSKVHIDNGAKSMWYIDENGKEQSASSGYEILVCN